MRGYSTHPYQLAVNLHIKFCHNTYFKIEIRKKYSVVSFDYQIWLRCYSATVSAIRSISPIYNKGTLFYGRACCCVLICPKERVSSSRLVATSTYILYLIAKYRYTDNQGHLRTLLDKFTPKFQ